MGEERVCGLVHDIKTHGGGYSEAVNLIRFCKKSLLCRAKSESGVLWKILHKTVSQLIFLQIQLGARPL
jgi:hypothetical protein